MFPSGILRMSSTLTSRSSRSLVEAEDVSRPVQRCTEVLVRGVSAPRWIHGAQVPLGLVC